MPNQLSPAAAAANAKPDKASEPVADNQTQRQQIRRHIRLARQQLSSQAQQQSAADLVRQISQLPELQTAQHIALYLSNDGELDTGPLLHYLQQQGKTLYLPVLHPFCTGYLLFQRYDARTPMGLNKFGIREPKPDVTAIRLVQEFDVILLPLVAFDAKGHRLGMGGGFYDRTLASLTPAIQLSPCVTGTSQASTSQTDMNQTGAGQKPLLVGLAHQCQQVAAIPAECWDVPLPVVVTPKQIWRF